MFESEDKKSLKNKYNKMRGISAQKRFKGGPDNTVYGELKLSEQLIQELEQIRNHVDDINERLEEVIYQRDTYASELE